jgi:hypothetical protein
MAVTTTPPAQGKVSAQAQSLAPLQWVVERFGLKARRCLATWRKIRQPAGKLTYHAGKPIHHFSVLNPNIYGTFTAA